MDFEKLELLIKEKKVKEFKKEIEEERYVDIAEFIENLDEKDQVLTFRMLSKNVSADVFSYLPVSVQEDLIQKMTDKEINGIIEELYIDDAVDLLDELPAIVVKKILQNAKPETRAELNQFLNYADYTAGSIMTSEYIALKKDITVEQAIKRIRTVAKDKEEIYTCYVTDSSRVLIGVVSIKQLLLADDDALVGDIMTESIISAKTSDDQESVSKLLQKYDLLALPVVDNEERLVGIITIDDAIDVIAEEAEEDFEKMAAMLPSDKPYFEMSVFSLFKNRIIWLLILMVTGMITGAILQKFETAIGALPLLVSFIPMLNDTGGNSGSQAATMCIRGIASGEISPKQWFKVWWKEFRVSLLISLTLVVFNFVRILLMKNAGETIGERMMYATVVCGTLLATVIIAKSIGALLPIFAKKIKLDPAVCAAPMITTIVDCCAILIYFALACFIFPQI